MNTLFVGIDVSTKHNQVCAVNFDQHVFFNVPFENTPDGSSCLLSAILDTVKNNAFDDIVCVAESTSVYDYHICAYLLDRISTIGIQAQVYSVNAKIIRNYKKSYNETEKTDPSDAFICADFARAGRCKKLTPFKANQNIALQRLTRERVHLSQQLVREKNYTLNNVYLKVSGLATATGNDKPFSDNFSAISEAILTEFKDPYDLAELSLDELIAYLRAASKNKGVSD